MRSAGCDNFNKWVLELGDGRLKCDIESVYGASITLNTPEQINETAQKVILTPKNVDTGDLNQKKINLIQGESHEYLSIDSMVTEDADDELNFQTEFLHSICPSGMPQHKLILKRGAFIMLLRNLNPKRGLLNGTRLIVEQMNRNFIMAEIISGSHKGEKNLHT